MIRILDSSFDTWGVIKNTTEASRVETLSGENTLSFTAILTPQLSSLITPNSIFELDGQRFDIKTLKKSLTEENSYIVEVSAEHISYRLNDPAYNEEYFTEIGTADYILAQMLAGTGFSPGTVDISTYLTYSAQEEKSRRALIMELAYLVEGELEFDNFTVNLLSHRGSLELKPAIKDRNVQVVSYEVTKQLGSSNIENYTCSPIGIPKDTYSLGDNILLLNKTLDIQEYLRVIRIEYNPYDESSLSFEFANYTSDLGDAVFEIITDAVSKDALMNGIRIGPEYGFEAVRNDRKARAYFRSDAMVFQSGDGDLENPEWTDRLYYEYDSEADETTLVFNGKFTVDVLDALTAIITNGLYAKKGYISDLTVDSLDTSTKVQKYLNGDTSDVNYLRIAGQVVQFINASIVAPYSGVKTGGGTWDLQADPHIDTYYASYTIKMEEEGDPPVETPVVVWANGEETGALEAYGNGRIYAPTGGLTYIKLKGAYGGDRYMRYDVFEIQETGFADEQVTTRNGEDLYWESEDHLALTTTETAFPAMIYSYYESVKMEHSFSFDGGIDGFVPKISLGAGYGEDSQGTGAIYRGDKGLYLDYYNSQDSELRRIELNDDGFKFTPEINLYGEKGNVSELTVDRLESSTKVQNYLDSDTSDVNYVKIVDQYVSFITATYASDEEQLTNRNDELLYWTDENKTDVTIKDVNYQGDPNDPVMVYTYTELTKMEMAFVYDEDLGSYVPIMILGAGTEPGVSSNGQAHLYKREDGLHIIYYKSDDGAVRRISLLDDGLEFEPELEGGGGGHSTSLSITVTADGMFYSEPWTHGYDTDLDLVQFVATPQYYNDAAVKLSDICVERVNNTQVRIVGRADVV